MMSKKVKFFDDELMEQSAEAKKFWGKAVEDRLPTPPTAEQLEEKSIQASDFAIDIMQYARGAESRGEHLFRFNYLEPIFNALQTIHNNVEWKADLMGNYAVFIGEAPETVLHVGHMDSVHDNDCSPFQSIQISDKGIASLAPIPKNSVPVAKKSKRYVNDVELEHHFIDYTLPPKLTRCLGADDGCAIAVMLYLMMLGKEGTYVMTRGEEIGCVGTNYMCDQQTIEEGDKIIDFSAYRMAIEVDRKGKLDMINSMSPGKTASVEFVNELSEVLGMGHKPAVGSITDVGYMAEFIPECVNISAGYQAQHTSAETTDLFYLDDLASNLAEVNWDDIGTTRAANEYTRTVARTTYGAGKSNLLYDDEAFDNVYGSTFYSRRNDNTYGDFTEEPQDDKRKFREIMAATTMQYQKEAWVRTNVRFMVEFLSALNLSPAEMDNVCQFGQIEAPSDNQE